MQYNEEEVVGFTKLPISGSASVGVIGSLAAISRERKNLFIDPQIIIMSIFICKTTKFPEEHKQPAVSEIK